MTCIVGIKHKGKVYLAGDSAGVSGFDIKTRTDEKVFHNGPMIMGYTTSFRMGQILRYSLKIPHHPEGMSSLEFMCTTFIDEVIRCFKDKGWLATKEGINSGGIFIVGYKGDLYKIDTDFQVGQHQLPYMATGCGEKYALGTLYIINQYEEVPPVEKLNYALESAANFSAGVCSPFLYVEN